LHAPSSASSVLLTVKVVAGAAGACATGVVGIPDKAARKMDRARTIEDDIRFSFTE